MGWPQNAYVGQKVVCVMASGHYPTAGEPAINIGDVKTIRGIVAYTAGIGLLFQEIKNPCVHTVDGFVERGYGIQRFRPVQEKSTETGMAILRKLLQPNSEQGSPVVREPSNEEAIIP